MTGIYIHVPFCAVKCPYCDFYSCEYNIKTVKKYNSAVLRNIEALPDIKADTVYFGGGTPSLLPAEYISGFIESIDKQVQLISPEITVEVNPCTVTEKKFNEYKRGGVNRLSFGIQSGCDDELEFLGRRHSFDRASKAVKMAEECGFDNISCDLMIGVKGQTKEKLELSVEKIASLPVCHISSYILKIEDNTPFGKNNISSQLPDDDETAELYLYSVRLLEKAGFEQYEISNFAKKGFRSRHNMKYWKCEEYIGIGPSAHSYYNEERYYSSADLESFCSLPLQDRISEPFEAGTDEEKIMLGIRLKDGICPDDFPQYREKIIKKSAEYCAHGLAVFENNRLSLTPQGFLVSNSIISDII